MPHVALTTPTWALAIAYWLHLVATVAWIGGLTALALIVLPAARRTLDLKAYASLLEALQRRLDLVGWFSLAILGATGLVQMSASPHYDGFLQINSPWAVAILAKHLVVLLMVATSAAITWGVLPAMRRQALLEAHGRPAPQASALQRRNLNLLKVNLLLSVLVLALTAFARSL